MRKIRHILIILILVFTLFGCFFVQPGPMAADDSPPKISSSLIKAIDARAAHRQPLSLLSGEAQEPLLDPLNVSVLIYTNSKPDAAQAADMASLGVTAYLDSWIPPVGTHPQGFITAIVPIGTVNDLAARSYVVRLDSAEGQSYRMNDVAATDIKASTFYSGGYTGAGVRLAVLDNGLDTTHPDFPAPVFAKDYWDYPVIGDNVTSPNPGGSDHGTHVAGSALGRGTLSGGKYKGIASGAEFVFIKIGNNVTGTASNAAMINALKDAVDRYGANIISMSYGGWSPHHDGTDGNCQAANYAVSKGAAVFISAGNEADKGKHYKGTVDANSTTGFIQVNVTGSDGINCALEHNLVWYDGLGVHNELTVQYYSAPGDAFTITTTSYPMEESTRGTERRQFEMKNPTKVIPAGDHVYFIKVSNTSASNQEFHIYYDGAPDNQVKFESPDIYYTLGSPGEADNVICVGSFNSRTSWTDYTGTVQDTGEALGAVSGFSNRGPRIDAGAPRKPDLVAPGSAIISCRDSSGGFDKYTVSNRGGSGLPANYYVMSGTSMATPVAAGSAALLMQAYPGLKGKPAEVKRLITPDNTPDNSWGYGLIDLQKTYNKAPQLASVQSGQGQVSFSTNAGTIGRLNATAAGAGPQGAGGYTFPYGLFSYYISQLSIGETIQVTVTLPAAGATHWVKSTANGWEPVPVISVNGNIMVIQLTDGGIGDDDKTAEGDIEDPGGPVIISSAVSTRPPSSSATMSVAPPAPPVMLPNITVQGACLSATTATPGIPVTVTADIINKSTVNSNKRVTLYINGQVDTVQGVTVNSGGSSQLTFTVSRSEPGDYTVYVDGVPAGSFKVEMVPGNDVIFIFSASLVAMAFLLGMVMLWRR